MLVDLCDLSFCLSSFLILLSLSLSLSLAVFWSRSFLPSHSLPALLLFVRFLPSPLQTNWFVSTCSRWRCYNDPCVGSHVGHRLARAQHVKNARDMLNVSTSPTPHNVVFVSPRFCVQHGGRKECKGWRGREQAKRTKKERVIKDEVSWEDATSITLSG